MTVAWPIYINFSSYGDKFGQNSKCHNCCGLHFSCGNAENNCILANKCTNVHTWNTNFENYFYWGSVIAILLSKTPAIEHRHLNVTEWKLHSQKSESLVNDSKRSLFTYKTTPKRVKNTPKEWNCNLLRSSQRDSSFSSKECNSALLEWFSLFF
jgi:hypothetical protein